MARQSGFWDFKDRLAQLSEQGDPLEKLDGFINAIWECRSRGHSPVMTGSRIFRVAMAAD